ncbi:MAG: 2-C-methyl-D-erythritol 4-phosphate cytidylyltransferase [bacterium]
MKIAAIVVAAGSGQRMGRPKQYLDLGGHPLLYYPLKVLQQSPLIDSIVLVVPQGEIDRVLEKIVRFYRFSKVLRIVKGGRERQDSVYNGLSNVPPETELVLVHDGARPFLTLKLIEEVIMAAARDGAAILGVPVTDTIKLGSYCPPSTVHRPPSPVTGGTRNPAWVKKTLPRSRLWAVQTPQAFKREILERAFKQAYAEGFYGTDEASLLERIGVPVRLVPGSNENMKITTPNDLALAEIILKGNRSATDAHR